MKLNGPCNGTGNKFVGKCITCKGRITLDKPVDFGEPAFSPNFFFLGPTYLYEIHQPMNMSDSNRLNLTHLLGY